MPLLKYWRDFIYAPTNPSIIRSFEDRLDLSLADEANRIGIVTQDQILLDEDDVFEAMEIDDHGGVFIWTRQNVWVIRQQFPMERLIFLPRHPPESDSEPEP